MEVDIINMFGLILRDNISKWGENYVQDIQTALLKSWNKHFANDSKL
jgi:hypothetical protein